MPCGVDQPDSDGVRGRSFGLEGMQASPGAAGEAANEWGRVDRALLTADVKRVSDGSMDGGEAKARGQVQGNRSRRSRTIGV